MFIKYTDSDIIFSKVVYNSETNTFFIKDRTGSNELECINIVPVINEYSPEQYELYLLQNKTSMASENSIFCVYMDDIRVGWIFPVQALLSMEHEYVNNIHFKKYAYVAMCKLLDLIEDNNQRQIQDNIDITDYYSSDLQVLLIDQDNIKNIENYSIDNYIVSLFEKGYSFTGEGNIFTQIDPIDKNLRLKRISPVVEKASYINVLFKSMIPSDKADFAQFYVLYQIIEIFIACIFNYEFKNLLLSIDEKRDKLFDKKEELNEISSEKRRIKRLINCHTHISREKSQILNDVCTDILKINGCNIYEDMASNLYAVRCLMIHNFFSVDDGSLKLLPKLNNAFLDVIFDMTRTFYFNADLPAQNNSKWTMESEKLD